MATQIIFCGLLPAAQAGSVQCENRASSGWQSTEQGSGNIDDANFRVEGNLDCSLHQCPCQAAIQHQLTCLWGQGAHYPSNSWLELLDVLSRIRQKPVFTEVLSVCLSLLPQSQTAEMWRQLSASTPITSLPSDQKLSPAGTLLGQARQTPPLQR